MAFETVSAAADARSLCLIFVWIDMLEGDNAQAAKRVSLQFPPTPAIEHFHDPERRLGSAIAHHMGASAKVAWDFYLLYPKGLEWNDVAPAPVAWFHQLQDEPWAGPDHYRWGQELGPTIRQALEEIQGFRAG